MEINKVNAASVPQVHVQKSKVESQPEFQFEGEKGQAFLVDNPAYRVLPNRIHSKTEEYIPKNEALFSWAEMHPNLSFDKISPESLVMVHRTEYFPEHGKILSTRLATQGADGVGQARNTVHTALNKSVTEHDMGNSWDSMPYAIILPFQATLDGIPDSKVLGGIQDDFFVLDELPLPKGTVILKYNPDIPQDTMRTSETGDGIHIVESSSIGSDDVDLVIKKMGYQSYNDALQEHLGATSDDFEILTSKPENEIQEKFDMIESFGGKKQYREYFENMLKSYDGVEITDEERQKSEESIYSALKFVDLAEKYEDKMTQFPKAWRDFCTEQGYMNGLHSKSSWFKGEIALCALASLEKYNNNSWDGDDYRERILRALEDAQAMLPPGKELGMDVAKVKAIISESDTPKNALQRLADEMKIKPMPPKDSTFTPEMQQMLESLDDETREEVLKSMQNPDLDFQFESFGI